MMDRQEASEELAKERLAICQTCPFYSVKKNLCKACGCPLRSKVDKLGSKCPFNLWTR